jgi:hypothetical protein
MAPTYEYTPLPEGTDQIRLLTLLPATEENEGITVSLQNIPTKEAERQYEALSYVWGSPENPETISVVTRGTRHSLTHWWRKSRWGKPKTGPADTSSSTGSEKDDVTSSEYIAAPLSVTKNLAIALRHLRLRDAPRTLWIDAICIDQQNIAEKGEQVAKMAQIYSSSARVVVWLGPASPDSDLAMRHVDHLGKILRYDPISDTFKLTSDEAAEPHWADTAQPLPYEEADVRALEKLFWRPWFERLWVVQELLLSPEAVVVCGSQETIWQSVLLSCTFLARKVRDAKTSLSDEFVSRLLRIEDVFDTTFRPSLPDLVYRTRGHKCADDRDRVYALLSLADETGKGRIKPDYSLSPAQVYRRLIALSCRLCDVRFLAHCELGSRKLAGPSWTPDWSAERMTEELSRFNAASFAWQPIAQSPQEGSIRIAAAHVGTIVGIDVVSIPSKTASLILPEIARLVPADVESSTYITGCSLMEAFSGTLVCSDFKPQVPRGSKFFTPQKAADTLCACLQYGDSDGVDGRYLDHVYRLTKNRALVRTEEGYIGMAPSDVREGDIIVAILSCTSFMVLRPCPGIEGRYLAVGESFVYGLNNGEAVLGPLPDHIHAVHQYHPEAGEVYEAYHDARTGGESWIDPRFEALGISFETKASGLPRRISPLELEKAGVRLLDIYLV